MRFFIAATLAVVFACPACWADEESVTASRGAKFATQVEKLLAQTTETTYQHTTKIDEDVGSVHCDCSGLIGYMLRREYPEAYLCLRGEQSPWRKRPLAVTYYETLRSAPTPASASPTSQWTQIQRLKDVLPGDVIAWRKPMIDRGSTTGHVLMVAGRPKVTGNGTIRVRIIDSTRSSKRRGLGSGIKTFTIDSNGRATGVLVGSRRQPWMIAAGRLGEPKKAAREPKDARFIGMDLETAKTTAKNRDLSIRVIRNDGQPIMPGWKIAPQRLNFVVEDGKVVDVHRG